MCLQSLAQKLFCYRFKVRWVFWKWTKSRWIVTAQISRIWQPPVEWSRIREKREGLRSQGAAWQMRLFNIMFWSVRCAQAWKKGGPGLALWVEASFFLEFFGSFFIKEKRNISHQGLYGWSIESLMKNAQSQPNASAFVKTYWANVFEAFRENSFATDF